MEVPERIWSVGFKSSVDERKHLLHFTVRKLYGREIPERKDMSLKGMHSKFQNTCKIHVYLKWHTTSETWEEPSSWEYDGQEWALCLSRLWRRYKEVENQKARTREKKVKKLRNVIDEQWPSSWTFLWMIEAQDLSYRYE